MALATKCPHCNTIFRVAHDQLKLRGGIVRCGACNEVFDGNAALLEPHAQPAPAILPHAGPDITPGPPSAAAAFEPATQADLAGPQPEPPPTAPADADDKFDLDLDVDLDAEPAPALSSAFPASQPWSELALPATPPEPVAPPQAEALDAAGAGEQAWSEPQAEAAEFPTWPEETPVRPAAPEIEAEAGHGRREPSLHGPGSAQAMGDGGQEHATLDDIDEPVVQLSAAALARAGQAPAEPEAAPAHAPEEPGFVRRDRRRQRYGKAATVGMAVASVLLLATLVGQGATTFRNQLAANLPQLKPALQTLCGALGCRVELPAQIEVVTIEQGELQTLSEHTFSFTTLLRNQSTTAQAWPHIELILDDAGDKAILRRVFAPRDYLAPGTAVETGFAPHTELAIKLYFTLSQLKASGYHIAVFYP